jgi:O-antigen ligase
VAGERAEERFRAALRQPVVVGALVWLSVLTASACYAPGPFPWSTLNTGVILVYPLVVASLLETTQWRTRGMMAFGAAAALVLLISWSQFFGLLPEPELAAQIPAYRYTVFKDYTQQGVDFLVLAAMAASFAMSAATRMRKTALWTVAILALVNVVFLLQSRTSYLVVAPLLLFWAWRLVGGRAASWRRVGVCALVLFAGAGAALMTPRVQERLSQAQQDVKEYKDKREATSMGIRLELWQRTLPIIASAPIFGHGLGQWDPQFEAATKDFPNYNEFRMHHPHQESLLILSEQGLVGYAIFITLLLLLARHIRRLSPPQHDFYASLLLIFVTASLANCLWPDFSHRHVFVMLLACIPMVARSPEYTRFQIRPA